MDVARLAAGTLHHPADAPPPVAHAAAELVRYLDRMCGTSPERRAVPAPPGAWLQLGDEPSPGALALPASAEGIVRATAGGGLAFAGATPRALLHAVYAFLESIGCRWSPWGADEEHVPVGPAVRPARELALRPPFARRAWTADLATWHYSMPERLAARLPGDVAFVDWMAKTGATGFLFIRHANDTQWTIPALATELAARGLDLEGGGHALVELLPRALFAAHPEYFPLGDDGARTDLGNACASSQDGLAVIRRNARAVCDELGLADLHLWGLDLFGGGWCRCPGCASLSPSDQALVLANDAAEDVAGRVYHLAYHDTIAVPGRTRPHPRVWAEFAPRERCYAHPIDDGSCATNVRYRDALVRHLDVFAGRVDVFEYYADAILYGGCTVPLADVIAADLDAYRRLGVRGVSCLTFGRYSLWAYGGNVEAFARAATGGERPAPAVLPHVAALGRLMADVLTHGDVLLPPDGAGAEAALARFDAVLAGAPEIRRLEAEATPPVGESRARRLAERQLVEYTFAALAAVRGWLAARIAEPPGPTRDAAAERALAGLAAAVDLVRAVDPAIAGTWGAHDLEITAAFFANALRARP